ncbi:MAG: sigma 54-interacting transcriptional regulator, partial [Terriglobales bacterium]
RQLPKQRPKGTARTEPDAAALSDQNLAAAWVAADPKSQKLLEQAKRVAAGGSTVLIRGESGSGKDLLASLIHYLGPGRDEPLVKIDCASLPLELLESELFGYEPGAFTGATGTKRGRLETAGEGTIVLDEIAALTLPMQAKVLRVIEEKRFERLGGTRTVAVVARIIALTNLDLELAVARGSFRPDLFYRLNVIPLLVPPLRERPANVRPLALHLLAQLAEVHRRPELGLSAAALAALEKYDFPGNVRELRNLLERAVVYAAGSEIRPEDLPAHVRDFGGASTAKKLSLRELERAHIAEILDFTRGRKSKAAAILGISRKALLEKRKRYGLD